MFDHCYNHDFIKIQDTPPPILEMDIKKCTSDKFHALVQSSDCWIVATEQIQTLSAIEIRTVELFAA